MRWQHQLVKRRAPIEVDRHPKVGFERHRRACGVSGQQATEVERLIGGFQGL
ncbi:hypothetical protein DPMN_105643 [Dreissena polymorpha]|uniref:Uncharacterized protein n=1 Tax=Dreissena polymorpha TaxID=45954 RepID=A0A9D4K3J9_DREPO|nr:hypothetical protein DPMN_105643 [Dreissena polymorpha]